MGTALFYTFSTIPQVLAAAIAMLAAFVLYRLQTINKQIEERSMGIQTADGNPPELWILHVKEEYEKLLNEAEKFRHPSYKFGRLHDLHSKRLRGLLNRKKDILKKFNYSLTVTVSLIIVSIIVLPFTPEIIRNKTTIGVVFIFGIFWFIVCICFYVGLVKKALES